jgi:hypothetical protein
LVRRKLDHDDRNVAKAIARLERNNAGRQRRSERPTDGYALRKCECRNPRGLRVS